MHGSPRWSGDAVRRGWTVVAVAFAAAALSTAIELAAFDHGDDAVAATLDGIVGAGMLAAGVLAVTRRPARRCGLIAVAAGLTWLGGAAWAPLTFLYRGPLAHLYLTYPSGRLRRSPAAGVVIAVYALSLAEPIAGSVQAMITTAALVGATAAWRSSRLTGTARPAGLLAAVAAAMFAGALLLGALNRVFGWQADRLALWVLDVVVLATVVMLLAARVWARWAPSVVTSLVVDLGRPPSGSLQATLARALGDPTLALGYWDANAQRYLDEGGHAVTASAGRIATTIDLDGEPTAVVVHDAAVLDDTALVDSVKVATRLALANRRMDAQARRRVEQLAASRRRLVEAADEQRRCLSRDIEDEVGNRLERVTALIDRVRAGGPVVAKVRSELDAARTEIDELASGIHPRVLDDGLAAALPNLAARWPLSVSISVGAGRLPAAIEAAIYFVCSEALTNVAKHASATSTSVDVLQRDEAITARIADDGRGGAVVSAGLGLRGLADRVGALGGTLDVDSQPGSGTQLTATIPLNDPFPTASRQVAVVGDTDTTAGTSAWAGIRNRRG